MKITEIFFIANIGLFVTDAGGMPAQPQIQLDLPATEIYGLGEQIKIDGMLKCLLKHNHIIEFPLDGHQPTTKEAGKYSCANVDAYNENSPITEWYMYMFGYQNTIKAGKAFRAIDGSAPFSRNHIIESLNNVINKISVVDNHKSMKTNIPNIQQNFTIDIPIIRAFSVNNSNFSQRFWQIFRIIAADPVGRVLLYRILIEIRRHDEHNNGMCEIKTNDINLDITRNHCRSLNVNEDTHNSFIVQHKSIYFDALTLIELPAIKITNSKIGTKNQKISSDIVLFHEMLHWYQYLRNPGRTEDESKDVPIKSLNYQYLSRCFYDASAFLIWTNSQAKNAEIRVILGSMDYREPDLIKKTNMSIYLKDRPGFNDYLEGDDLSENAYRVSRFYYAYSRLNPNEILHPNGRRQLQNGISAPAMRWGHTDVTFIEEIDPESIKKFQLANRIARLCFYKICGTTTKWELKSGKGAL